jgi:hypothetical protein
MDPKTKTRRRAGINRKVYKLRADMKFAPDQE